MPLPAGSRARARLLAVPAADVLVVGLGLAPMSDSDGNTYRALTEAHWRSYLLSLGCLLIGLALALLPDGVGPLRRSVIASVGSLSAVGVFAQLMQQDPYASSGNSIGWYLNVAVLALAAVASTAGLARRATALHRRSTGAVAAVLATVSVAGGYLGINLWERDGFPQESLWWDEIAWSVLYVGALALVGMTLGSLSARRWFVGACWLLGPVCLILITVYAQQHWWVYSELFGTYLTA